MEKVEIKGKYTWLDYIGASEGAFKAKKWTRRLSLLSSILFYVLSINTLSSLGKENGRIILGAYAIILIILLWMPYMADSFPIIINKSGLKTRDGM